MQSKQNFVNPAFAAIYDGITARMPSVTFGGIIVTYLVTAALNVHFIPLPIFLSIPAALSIQFGRFAVVFMDFLNPTGRRSFWPGAIATAATGVALAELAFSLQDVNKTGPEFWALFLFGGMVIAFGYVLEINFISKGAEAFGMTTKQPTAGAVTSPARSTNGTTVDDLVKMGLETSRLEKVSPQSYAALMRSFAKGENMPQRDREILDEAIRRIYAAPDPNGGNGQAVPFSQNGNGQHP